jgi:hypothetical protein
VDPQIWDYTPEIPVDLPFSQANRYYNNATDCLGYPATIG